MAQVLKPTPVAQARSGGKCILGLKSMAQVLKLTPVAQADSGRTQATPVVQADFGRNLKPALAAKLLVFSVFSFALAFRKVLFIFCILSPPRVAQSRLLQSHLKVRSAWHPKVDFFSRISKSAPRGILKSTSKVAYQSLLRAATKVDFGFQVASQSPLHAAQSRLRFLSRILKSALPASKVEFGRN
jgi:hypothetical protein